MREWFTGYQSFKWIMPKGIFPYEKDVIINQFYYIGQEVVEGEHICHHYVIPKDMLDQELISLPDSEIITILKRVYWHCVKK